MNPVMSCSSSTQEGHMPMVSANGNPPGSPGLLSGHVSQGGLENTGC